MIIQHNIMAINSHRQLTINNSNLAKNLEKLSSGYRINRAADDAAGLAISEKMRAQITGLERASLNAQDGASLIQTAEGALTEVHSMLNRMVELATQSANGTIQDDDRQKIEAEVTALKEEIDRISKATNFNGINLLDGSLSTEGGSNSVSSIKLDGIDFEEVAATKGTFTANVLADQAAGTTGNAYTYRVQLNDGSYHDVTLTYNADEKLEAADGTIYEAGDSTTNIKKENLSEAIAKELAKISDLGENFKFTGNADGSITIRNRTAGGDAPQVTGVSVAAHYTPSVANPPVPPTMTDLGLSASAVGVDAYNEVKGFVNDEVFTVNGVKFAFVTDADAAKDLGKDVNYVNVDGSTINAELQAMADLINQKTGLGVEINGTNNGLNFKVAEGGVAGKGGLTMQVGDTADDFNKITVSVDDMSSKGLGIDLISMGTQEAAAAALDKVKAAIEKVSVNRGNLGALQNRLEHTINNLGVTTENMTAAESRIRDVDMAKEMMAFTKNNVLAQAAQAMLAQANQQPQMVLQLLR